MTRMIFLAAKHIHYVGYSRARNVTQLSISAKNLSRCNSYWLFGTLKEELSSLHTEFRLPPHRTSAPST